MNLPQIFKFDNQQIRTITKDGEPWFVAVDVCDSLLMNVTQIRRLEDDEKGLHSIQTLGGNQNLAIVNESGLYSLIMSSRKPEAKRFKKWVTSEVIPAIRKTGSYVAQSPEIQIAHAMLLAGQMIEGQKALIAEMSPKADFFDAVTDSTNAVDIGVVAKVLNMGIGRNLLFQLLRELKVIQTTNLPYQKYIDLGYFRVIESKYQKPDGSTHVSFKTVVYQKGIDAIRKMVTKHLPEDL